jgi:hypothetical protein
LSKHQETVTQLDETLKSLTTIFGQRCQDIKVEALAPLDFVALYEPASRDKVQKLIEATDTSKPLTQLDLIECLELCAPRYFYPDGPRVLICSAPELAEKLIVLFPQQQQAIRNTLSPSPEEIVAIIAHEKYGHGYLHLETKLGQQLACILEDDEIYRAVATAETQKFSNSPWKRDFVEVHHDWLVYLLGSALVVQEGFASWVQTKLLLKMGGSFAIHAARKLTRHPFSVPFRGLIPFLPYFQERGYPTITERLFSPHKQGYDWIDEIYELMGYGCMPCVLQVMREVMDIDFGISKDSRGVINVPIPPQRLLQYLKDGSPEYYLADQRLLAARNVLVDDISNLKNKRQNWECQVSGPFDSPTHRPCIPYLDQLSKRLPDWLQGESFDEPILNPSQPLLEKTQNPTEVHIE